MGRMKEVFMMQRQHELENNEHFDDEYWYAKYLEERQAKEQNDDDSNLSDAYLPDGSTNDVCSSTGRETTESE